MPSPTSGSPSTSAASRLRFSDSVASSASAIGESSRIGASGPLRDSVDSGGAETRAAALRTTVDGGPPESCAMAGEGMREKTAVGVACVETGVRQIGGGGWRAAETGVCM